MTNRCGGTGWIRILEETKAETKIRCVGCEDCEPNAVKDEMGLAEVIDGGYNACRGTILLLVELLDDKIPLTLEEAQRILQPLNEYEEKLAKEAVRLGLKKEVVL